VSSDATPTPQSEPTGADYGQRALLLADLGRYDEAADELAAGLAVVPDDPDLLTTLARVHLAADQPAPALTAAERAMAAAPDTIAPMVVRAMALADARRFGEAARIGDEMLRRWPDDPYAQRTGAALLSETRNGQDALNAAWGAVSLSPTDAEAHLVLGVVSARLRLFDLAQRAYGEALELDPDLSEAQHDLGVVRLERRRWAKALEELADAAAFVPPADPAQPATSAPPTSGRSELSRSDPALTVSRPAGAVLDTFAESAEAVRMSVRFGAGGIIAAAVLTALMAIASPGASRAWAAIVGMITLVTLVMWLRHRLTEPVATVFRRLRTQDRRLAWAAYATGLSALLIMAYAVLGGPIPLVAALATAALAELTVILRRN
jgi:tetratricopeptide (TPR) repeat protein